MAGLLSMDEVRKELEMTDEQVTKLQEARTKMFETMRSSGGFNREEFQNLSDEERQKRMETFRADMEKRTSDMLKEVLLPGQIQRLEQLSLQREGTQALGNQKVINALNITPEQQAELTKIGEGVRAQITEIYQGAGRDATEEQRAQNREKVDAIRKAAEKKAIGVLSDEQKAALGKLMGKPFEFPERQAFGGGGQRGGGAAGGGAGGGQRGGDRGGRQNRPQN
jgi:hypothetical protein